MAELDITWRDGELLTARLRSTVDGEAQIRYRDSLRRLKLSEGQHAVLRGAKLR